ncbi:hypothetical protein PINS_up024136 [Pythium insidiosum]|nr:hypothetical protein PINS_up024136 [Pythium insidiosum]
MLSSAFCAAAPSEHQPPSARQQYPLSVTVDFTKLRANALRRYMAFHGLQELPGSSQSQLAVAVARHFSEQCKLTDEERSIALFLAYVRGAAQGIDDEEIHGDTECDRAEAQSNGGCANSEDLHGATSDVIDGDKSDDDNSMDENEHEPEREPHESFSGDDGAEDDDDDHASNDQESSSDSKSAPRKRKSSSSNNKATLSHYKKQKKRKTRLYCVCHGSSFGNMIACDSKKCADRSNWFHMACVGLDPSKDPPETWFCPSCQSQERAESSEVPEHQYRKPVASVTYGDMISHALTVLPNGKGTFKEICDFVEKQYESQLNWKLESDQRKSPVWKSSVRKILFSNVRFRKHPDDKGHFCLAA